MMDGNFISRKRIGGIVALSFLQFGNLSGQERPNIVMILADDMGYSDIGCYGSEIETPHIDSLALQGIRLTQFYNTSRKSYDWFVSTSSWDRMDVRRSF